MHTTFAIAGTHSAAYGVGYLLGIVFGVAGFIGCFVFAVVAVVKAFTRRTTGWIISGVISGSLMLLLLVVFGFVVVAGLISNSTRTSTAVPVRVAADDWRPVYGRQITYGLKMPPGWEVSSIENTFLRIGLFEQGMFIEVMADRGNVGSPEKVWNIYAPGKEDRGTTDPVPVTLDGRRWLRFTEVEETGDAEHKIKVKCELYVYGGPEGSYVMKCAAPPNVFQASLPRMREVINTFRFPNSAGNM